MKLFYDHLIDKGDLINLIQKHAQTVKEKENLLSTLDELVHHTVLDVILVHLDRKHHEEFLALMHETPHSQDLLIYLREKASPEIEEKIKTEIERLKSKIFKEAKTS